MKPEKVRALLDPSDTQPREVQVVELAGAEEVEDAVAVDAFEVVALLFCGVVLDVFAELEEVVEVVLLLVAGLVVLEGRLVLEELGVVVFAVLLEVFEVVGLEVLAFEVVEVAMLAEADALDVFVEDMLLVELVTTRADGTYATTMSG